MKQVIGAGLVNLWPGGSLWIGLSSMAVEPHAHHAIQVSLALDGPVRLRAGGDAHWTEYLGAMVPPHVPHEFEAIGNITATIFCEPESATGRRLLDRFGTAGVAALPDDEVVPLAAHLNSVYASSQPDDVLNAAARDVLDGLAGRVERVAAPDARVAKALAEIARRLDQPFSLNDIADAVHISPSRLRHLFVQETGMAFRPYVLWLRLQHALERAVAGSSWTEAAHSAHFADLAHLSRTFRRMYGMAPMSMARERSAAVRSLR